MASTPRVFVAPRKPAPAKDAAKARDPDGDDDDPPGAKVQVSMIVILEDVELPVVAKKKN